MASSEETPTDIISENQESEQPESEESSEAFNCEGLDHCYDTEDNLDRHLTDGEWSQCDHIVCPHRYSGSTNFELSEWALYPAHWQESLEFSTWFLSRGLLPEPHNLTALPSQFLGSFCSCFCATISSTYSRRIVCSHTSSRPLSSI